MNRQSNKTTALYCRIDGGKYMSHAFCEIMRQLRYVRVKNLFIWKGGRA